MEKSYILNKNKEYVRNKKKKVDLKSKYIEVFRHEVSEKSIYIIKVDTNFANQEISTELSGYKKPVIVEKIVKIDGKSKRFYVESYKKVQIAISETVRRIDYEQTFI